MDLDQYIKNKRRAEKRAEGFVEYASVEIHHEHELCSCNGDNPRCRFTTRREWRKPNPTNQKIG